MAVHSHRTHSITTYNFEQIYPRPDGAVYKKLFSTLYEFSFCATYFLAFLKYKGKMFTQLQSAELSHKLLKPLNMFSKYNPYSPKRWQNLNESNECH